MEEPSGRPREEDSAGGLDGEEPARLAHHAPGDEGKGGLGQQNGEGVAEVGTPAEGFEFERH